MNAGMQQRTRQFGLRLAVTLLLVGLLGTGLGLLIRKEQSLTRMVEAHRKISANLPLMRRDTQEIKQQISAFNRLIPADQPQRSNELLLYSRLDQIKTTLKPLEMTVATLENKDSALSASFTLKLPLQGYSASINSLGVLQRESFPFVVFKSVTLDAMMAGGQITIEGSVIMPVVSGGKP